MSRTSITLLFLALYMLVIVGVGIWNRKSKDSEDYFLASRKLPSWLLAVTFIASWWGGGSAIDLVDHAHQNGLNSFWIYGRYALHVLFN
jgi:SSS family solute:Na+ symporter